MAKEGSTVSRFLMSWGLPILLILGIQHVASRGLLTERAAPELSGALVEGPMYPGLALEQKPVLIYFWGSWCGVCKAMQGSISRVAEDHRVISVALRSGSASDIRSYMEGQGFKVPTIPDPEGRIGEAYGVRGVPALFFLDQTGRIRTATVGFTTEPGIRLRLWWLERS
ncbi:MAG: protein disulfide oxidoreductase [Verrucomicrobia bacterium]|nr:protein disulfide oxidoreductase [Verrucomicrobiota bacterium]